MRDAENDFSSGHVGLRVVQSRRMVPVGPGHSRSVPGGPPVIEVTAGDYCEGPEILTLEQAKDLHTALGAALEYAAALAEGPGPTDDERPAKDAHQIEHESYGTWPCVWMVDGREGDESCPIMVSQRLAALSPTPDERPAKDDR